jgi:hypothetical protein
MCKYNDMGIQPRPLSQLEGYQRQLSERVKYVNIFNICKHQPSDYW